jgi:hypothetical protein
MNRRDFLRRASLVAAGAVAADQLDLIERLGWRRKLFPGWSPTPSRGGLYRITGVESAFPINGLSTMTVSLLGENGVTGAVVLDAKHPSARRMGSRFRTGDLVRLSGDWGDWGQLGDSLLRLR